MAIDVEGKRRSALVFSDIFGGLDVEFDSTIDEPDRFTRLGLYAFDVIPPPAPEFGLPVCDFRAWIRTTIGLVSKL